MQDQVYLSSPGTKKLQLLIEQQVYQMTMQQLSKGKTNQAKLSSYVVPVVVHIIHDNGVENISDSTVLQGIQDLNDAFENIGFYLPSTGVDVDIEFCLARQDEFGNFTSGINRVQSTLTDLDMNTQDLQLKNLIRWDPTKYLNIWLVREITSNSMGSSVAGYAYYPSSHGNPEDGVVNEARWFGNDPDDSKIHVHEVGHYLGLKHTFDGGCTNANCLTDGDNVCDTPPDASTAPVTCIGTINTCTTDDDDTSLNNPFRPIANGGLGDQNDMIINYMDYGFQICQSAFTDGQKNRMIFMLTGARSSLLQSMGCDDLCTTPITSSFTASNTTVNIGGTVIFTNQSVGASSYEWVIDGTPFSSGTDTSYTFNAVGTYTITLNSSNGDPACTDSFSLNIVVTCPVNASFLAATNNIEPGDSITFTNTSTGATSYEWFLDGVSISTSQDFTNVFNSIGGYMVSLVAFDGVCYDTSTFLFVRVGTCTTKEADVWYFGYQAGIDFSNGSPLPLTDGKTDAFVGTATVAHRTTGDLLFYTDGDTVWNSTHVAMPNGGDLNSDPWMSTQAALTVPWPGDTSKYYIFTAAPYWDTLPEGGIQYSVVDMTLNGGLGDVTTKNQLLLFPATEKLAGVKHCNGVDYWVLTHDWNSNNFYAWLITNGGITDTVISSAGKVHAGDDWLAMGSLKASPDGKRLAVAVMDFDSLYSTEIFDFNAATGIVSNAIELPSYPCPFGLSFSPNSSMLYVASFEWCTSEKLIQFDVSSGDSATIAQSEFVLDSIVRMFGLLQLGPDGRIYVTMDVDQYLSVITNPNAPGTASNYVVNGFFLGGAYGSHGLPNFVESYFYDSKPEILGPAIVCQFDTSVVFSLDDISCSAGAIEWEIKGGANISGFTDSTATLEFNGSGVDTLIVEISSTCGVTYDTVLVIVSAPVLVDLGNDTTICTGSNFTFDAGLGFGTYEWQDSSTNQLLTASTQGQYWVKVVDGVGCISSDSVFLTVADSSVAVNLGNDTAVCDGNIVSLNAGAGYDQYLWQDNSTNQSLTTWSSGIYWVQVTNACGKTATDSIIITVALSGSINLGNDTSICQGTSSTLDAGSEFISYQWQDGSSNQNHIVTVPGEYWVIATDSSGCYTTDSISISLANASLLDLGSDTSLCDGTSIIIDAGSGFTSYIWQDASSAQTFTASTAGIIWVQVSDSIGCISTDTIVVAIIDTTITINLGADTGLCSGDTLALNPGGGNNTFVWQDGSTDSVHYAESPGIYWVVSTNGCGKSATDSITLLDLSVAGVDLGDDRTYCEKTITTFDAGSSFSNYLWQDGSNGQTFSGSSQGTYWVIAEDVYGCTYSDSVTIVITSDVCLYSVFVPDIFSPNGDDENDHFFIQGKGIDYLNIIIYDRWGKKIFENNGFSANDPLAGWDGTLKGKSLNPAVFVYVLTGSYTDKSKIEEQGDFTLVK
jgi:gliding motility-associated-like protein